MEPSKVTPLFPGADQDEAPQPVASPVRRVEWLAALLGETVARTYDYIRTGKVPPEAVLRLGRSVRILEHKILEWLRLDEGQSQAPTA